MTRGDSRPQGHIPGFIDIKSEEYRMAARELHERADELVRAIRFCSNYPGKYPAIIRKEATDAR